MKNITTTAALLVAMLATPLTAGSLSDPVVEPETIAADTEGSSSGASLVLALAVLLSIPVATD